MPLSPLAVNLWGDVETELDISPPVLSGNRDVKGNLAPKNPPPPTSRAHEQRLMKNHTVAAAVRMATPPTGLRASKAGNEKKNVDDQEGRTSAEGSKEGQSPAPRKVPTTFFSHDHYYNEPKKADVSAYRSAAEIAYGRRGRGTMSRARDVAIAGSALRSRPGRSPNPVGNAAKKAAMRAKKEAGGGRDFES